jgi:FixJ family two-component response regulator
MKQLRLLSIFVVDDEPVIVKTVVALLQINGFSASPFTNPLDVLNKAQFEAPDLLICDVMMPQLSGIELAIRIKDLCPHCKILLFSGHGNVNLMLESAQAKGYDFNLLSKPVHPKDLLDRVRLIETDHSLSPRSATRRKRVPDGPHSRIAALKLLDDEEVYSSAPGVSAALRREPSVDSPARE